MRHGPGLPIIVGTATAGVPGNERGSSAGDHLSRGSSPPVPLSRWERGNEGRVRRPGRLLEPAERHHAVPPGGRGAARQLGRSVGAGSGERCPLGPGPQCAGSDALGDARGRLLPATAVECELPRFVRRLPGPECLGRRRECFLGPGRVRRHPPYRSGAGRAGGRGPGRPARRAGQPDRGGGPRLFRAAGSAGAAPSGPAERREPAPHVRPYQGAARRGARQCVRYGAGAGAAQLDAGLDSRPRGSGGGGPVPHRYPRRPLAHRGCRSCRR